MPLQPKREYKTEEELKILKKIKEIRKKTEEMGDGDEWFKKYYLKDLAGSGKLKNNKFKITELKKEEIKKLDYGVKSFLPYACRKCNYDGNIPRRIFKMEIIPKNEKEWKELKIYMKKKYKIEYFRVKRGIGINAIISGECPRCESQRILFDYSLFITKPGSSREDEGD
jgi:predicted Zn-ribbon and HTH transcriptional regulator